MSDLDDLYHDTILDHGRSPRRFRPLPGATHHAEGYNPLCGDRVHVELILRGKVDEATIDDIAFTGAACAICLASASMMAEHVKGLGTSEARRAAEDFRRMLVGGVGDEPSAVSRQPSAEGTEAPRDQGIEGSRHHGNDAISTQHATPGTQHSALSTRHLSDSPLVALAGVRKFPMRVKCATLPWHTLLAAIESGDAAVPTDVDRRSVSTE